jgi:hypothetical protein
MDKSKSRLSFIFIVLFIMLFASFIVLSIMDINPMTTGNLIKALQNKENTKTNLIKNIVSNANDPYKKPDFELFKKNLKKENIINDIPRSGNLRIIFYHFFEKQKVIDYIIYITKGNIEVSNEPADIDIFISSDYVAKFDGTNLCNTIQVAKNKGDLGYTLNLSKARLLLKYSSMMKYKSCFGF